MVVGILVKMSYNLMDLTRFLCSLSSYTTILFQKNKNKNVLYHLIMIC